MEFKIISPQDDQFARAIEFNYDEMKAYLAEQLEKYNNMVYSDDSISTAKEDRAKLNKLYEAIDTKRKEIKKECLKPYEEFEKRVKEILALIETPTTAIDSQVKNYENAKKEEKRKEIESIYEENIGNLKEILPLAKIWNEKWTNAGPTIKAITKELTGSIEKVAADIVVIDELNSEYALQIKDMYIRTLDLSAALREKTRLEEQKAKLEEYQRKQEEESRENAAAEPKPETQASVQEAEETRAAEPEQAETVQLKEIVKAITFTVHVNKEQYTALNTFLKVNKIKTEMGGR